MSNLRRLGVPLAIVGLAGVTALQFRGGADVSTAVTGAVLVVAGLANLVPLALRGPKAVRRGRVVGTLVGAALVLLGASYLTSIRPLRVVLMVAGGFCVMIGAAQRPRSLFRPVEQPDDVQ